MDGQLTQLWTKFLKDFRVLTFKKGEVILFQGEVPKYAHVVKKGIVKTYTLSTKGDEQLMYLSIANDIFRKPGYSNRSLVPCIIMRPFQIARFIVCREIIIWLSSLAIRQSHGELERSIRRDVGVTSSNALLQPKASAKLVNTLHYFAHAHATLLNVNDIKLNIILTNKQFANLSRVNPRTVAIELSNLSGKA